MRKHAYQQVILKRNRKCKFCKRLIFADEEFDVALECVNNCNFSRIHKSCFDDIPDECKAPESVTRAAAGTWNAGNFRNKSERMRTLPPNISMSNSWNSRIGNISLRKERISNTFSLEATRNSKLAKLAKLEELAVDNSNETEEILHDIKRLKGEIELIQQNIKISDLLEQTKQDADLLYNKASKRISNTAYINGSVTCDSNTLREQLQSSSAVAVTFVPATNKSKQYSYAIDNCLNNSCGVKESLKFARLTERTIVEDFAKQMKIKQQILAKKRRAWKKVKNLMENKLQNETECLTLGEQLLAKFKEILNKVEACTAKIEPVLHNLNSHKEKKDAGIKFASSANVTRTSSAKKTQTKQQMLDNVESTNAVLSSLLQAIQTYRSFNKCDFDSSNLFTTIFHTEELCTLEEITNFTHKVSVDVANVDTSATELRDVDDNMIALGKQLNTLEEQIESDVAGTKLATLDTEKSNELARDIMETTAKLSVGTGDVLLVNLDDESDANGVSVIKSATVSSMINVLTSTDETNTVIFQKSFFTTYRYFLSPIELLEKLISIYCKPNVITKSNSKSPVVSRTHSETSTSSQITKKRVLILIQYWIVNYFSMDFEEKEIRDLAISFLTDTAGKIDKSPLAATILEIVQAKVTVLDSKDKVDNNIDDCILDYSSDNYYKAIDVANYAPSELALNLSIYELDIYSNLKWHELTNQKWNGKQKFKAPTILRLIRHFNGVANWVVESILAKPTVEARAYLVKRYIAIALHFLRLNNYSGALQIASGLDNNNVSRLKHTWHLVGKDLYCIKERIVQLLHHNFLLLRTELSKGVLPAIPYIGIFLKDLTFVEDGNPTFEDAYEFPVINFYKFRKIAEIIGAALRYTQSDYGVLNSDESYNCLLMKSAKLFSLHIDSEAHQEKIYKKSKELEPSSVTSAYSNYKFVPLSTEEELEQLQALRSHGLLIQEFNEDAKDDEDDSATLSSSSQRVKSMARRASSLNSMKGSKDKLKKSVEPTVLSERSITETTLESEQNELDYYQEVATCMSNKISGVLVKDRKWRMRKFPQCFIAKEAVDWMVRNLAIPSREQAVVIGQALIKYNFIRHVCDDHHFKDKFLFFQFVDRSKLLVKLSDSTSTFDEVTDNPFKDTNTSQSEMDSKQELEFEGIDDDDTVFPLDISSAEEAKILQLAERMKKSDSGLVVKNRKWRFKKFNQCFLGCEAVDWIVINMPCSRAEAISVGRKMMRKKVFRHVCDDHDFKDKALFYTFI